MSACCTLGSGPMITRWVCVRPLRVLTMFAPRPADARALDVGVFVVLERAELDEQSARIGHPLRHRLRQRATGAATGAASCRGVGPRAGAARRRTAGRRQIGLLHLAARRGGDLKLRRARHRIDRRVAFRRQHLQPHAHRGVGRKAQQRRGAARHLDQPVRRRRPSVVDAHQHLEAVLQVGEARDGGKLQRLVRGGERRLIERLAIRGQLRMARRIDGREPGLLAFVALARIVPDAAGLIGSAQDIVRIGRWRPMTGRRQQRQQQSAAPVSCDDGVAEQADHQRVVVRRVVAADRGEVRIDQERIAAGSVRQQHRGLSIGRAPEAARPPRARPAAPIRRPVCGCRGPSRSGRNSPAASPPGPRTRRRASPTARDSWRSRRARRACWSRCRGDRGLRNPPRSAGRRTA